jgi:hypothetical protein
MTSTLLHLFFSGMIAFVNDRPAEGMMSAYVVKAVDHDTSLEVEITDDSVVDDISGAHCEKRVNDGRVFLKCTDIYGYIDVELRPSSANSAHRMYAKPQSVRPFNKGEASDLSWLVHMSTVDEDSGQARPFEEVSGQVSLQMGFGWKKAQACHLDQVEVGQCLGANCSFQINPVHFVKSISSTLGHVQAVAESVMFELEMPDDDVSLYLADRHGDQSITVKLKCSSGKCADLFVANDPNDKFSEMDDVGLHFLGYYVFAAGTPQSRFPVRLRENAVPFSIGGKGQLFTCTIAAAGSGGRVPFGAQTRIICPMVIFEN